MNNVAYEQPTNTPTPKVTSAGVGGAVTSIVLWLIGAFSDVEVSAEAGAALATLIAFLAAYMTRDKKPPQAVEAILKKGETNNYFVE